MNELENKREKFYQERCTVTVGTKSKEQKYCPTALRKGSVNTQLLKLIKKEVEGAKSDCIKLFNKIIAQGTKASFSSVEAVCVRQKLF